LRIEQRLLRHAGRDDGDVHREARDGRVRGERSMHEQSLRHDRHGQLLHDGVHHRWHLRRDGLRPDDGRVFLSDDVVQLVFRDRLHGWDVQRDGQLHDSGAGRLRGDVEGLQRHARLRAVQHERGLHHGDDAHLQHRGGDVRRLHGHRRLHRDRQDDLQRGRLLQLILR